MVAARIEKRLALHRNQPIPVRQAQLFSFQWSPFAKRLNLDNQAPRQKPQRQQFRRLRVPSPNPRSSPCSLDNLSPIIAVPPPPAPTIRLAPGGHATNK